MSCDPQTLVTGLGCWMNIDPIRLQAIILRLLCAIRDGETMSCDPQTLANEAACIQNCMTTQMILAAQAKLLCDLSAALSAKITCATTGAPTGDPGLDCALYYNHSGNLYGWNDATGNWVAIV